MQEFSMLKCLRSCVFGFVFLKLVLLCSYSNVLSIYLRGKNIGSKLV